MEIIQKLPLDVSRKIMFHFKHPSTDIIRHYWKEPHILMKKYLIAELNRFNWITHSVRRHNWGKSWLIRSWVKHIKSNHSKIAATLKIHKSLDPEGAIIHPMYNGINIRQVAQFICLKLWHHKRVDDHNEWIKRSAFGGVYSFNKRPKVKVPRNPWTKKWNIRWKKNGVLRKLCSKKWKAQPWRKCEWEGRGAIVNNNVYMGPINIEFIPAVSWDRLDPII